MDTCKSTAGRPPRYRGSRHGGNGITWSCYRMPPMTVDETRESTRSPAESAKPTKLNTGNRIITNKIRRLCFGSEFIIDKV